MEQHYTSDLDALVDDYDGDMSFPEDGQPIRDDLLVVKGDGGTFEINIVEFRNHLRELSEVSNVQVSKLTPDKAELFTNVTDVFKLLYPTPSLYDSVINDAIADFKDVQHPIPGTVAAYIIGCYKNNNFTGEKGCDPACAGSLHPSQNTPGFSPCEQVVLLYSEEEGFRSLNERGGDSAYIYVDDHAFRGFTDAELAELRNSGINKVSLVVGSPSGYSETTDFLPLNELPHRNGANRNRDTTTTNTTNNGVWIVLLIAIVIILILVGILAWRRRY